MQEQHEKAVDPKGKNFLLTPTPPMLSHFQSLLKPQLVRRCSKGEQRQRGLRHRAMVVLLLGEKGRAIQHEAAGGEDARCSVPTPPPQNHR